MLRSNTTPIKNLKYIFRSPKLFPIFLVTFVILFVTLRLRDYIQLHNDPYWINYQLRTPSIQQQEREIKKMTQRRLDTRIDAPFQYGCKAPESLAPGKLGKANAAFVMLCRNSEIEGVLNSIQSMERHFNQWYNYPWIFLNNDEFTEEFKAAVLQHTHSDSDIQFGKIDAQDWDFPNDVDQDELYEWIELQGDRKILYGNMVSYHKMCRFYLGKFYQHPLVKKLDWYWRVEPDVEFFCDLTYDPFLEMEKRGKKYGFNVMLPDLYYSIPGLFRHVQAFIKQRGITPKSSWRLFTHDKRDILADVDAGEDQENWATPSVYDGMTNEQEIKTEVQDQIYLSKFLHDLKDKDESVFQKYPQIAQRLISESKKLPQLYEDLLHHQEYNLCHFWSNFEIARVDLFTSETYQDLFNYLDKSGGFYKERWGDAPVHSLAVGMMLDLKEIHYFRDIGYRHGTFVHCPANAPGEQLAYEPSTNLPRQFENAQKGGGGLSDKPRFNGVGCRCKCPTKYMFRSTPHHDMENLGCMEKWAMFTQNSYRVPKKISVLKWKKRITKMIDLKLKMGGKLGDLVV